MEQEEEVEKEVEVVVEVVVEYNSTFWRYVGEGLKGVSSVQSPGSQNLYARLGSARW